MSDVDADVPTITGLNRVIGFLPSALMTFAPLASERHIRGTTEHQLRSMPTIILLTKKISGVVC